MDKRYDWIWIALIILSIGGSGFYWFDQYVAPKDRVVMAANQCSQTDTWEACFEAADAEHATTLLRTVGY
jgi:hypothetical protein